MLSQLTLLTGAVAVATAFQPSRVQHDARDMEACLSVAESFLPELTNVPTPDEKMVDFLAEQTQMFTYTDKCIIPTVTGSMAAEYTSWVSEMTAWQQKHKTVFEQLVSACSDVPEVQEQIDAYGGTMCETMRWEGGQVTGTNTLPRATDAPAKTEAGATGSGTPGATGSSTPGATSSSTATAAGSHREAGMVMAVVAAGLAVAAF